MLVMLGWGTSWVPTNVKVKPVLLQFIKSVCTLNSDINSSTKSNPGSSLLILQGSFPCSHSFFIIKHIKTSFLKGITVAEQDIIISQYADDTVLLLKDPKLCVYLIYFLKLLVSV